jgi:polysaccharide biosynthesis/export protein
MRMEADWNWTAFPVARAWPRLRGRERLALGLLLAAAVLGATDVAAQQNQGGRHRDDANAGAPREQPRDSPQRAVEPAATPVTVRPAPLLDAPVSRTLYRLGPGDVVDLAIFGERSMLHQLTVTPEGAVVIPSVGVVSVLGLNLDEAQARTRQAVLRYFQNVGIYLTLSQVRQFKVFVVGDVVQAGVQVASAATRVSEILDPLLDPERRAQPRNVLVRRANGDTVRVDLHRFHLLGDLEANPTLREGDAIVVPVADRMVRVFGRVAFPGNYEYRAGETLTELLTLANGGNGFPSDAADSIRVSRAVGLNGQRVVTLTQGAAEGTAGRDLVLEPFDAIYVPWIADYMEQPMVTLKGQVRFPGDYPIRADTTTVRELIQLAGGFTDDASLATASLRREGQGLSERMLRQLQSVPPELLSSSERRVMQAGSQGDETRVVIDFQRLFAEGDDAHNQVLRRGDTLEIPRHRDDVIVVGAVLRPGSVQWLPGQKMEDFVRLSGGYSRQADRSGAMVVKPNSGGRIPVRDVRSFEAGDMIIVPYRENRNYLQMLQTTSTVVTTLAGLVLTFLAISR